MISAPSSVACICYLLLYFLWRRCKRGQQHQRIGCNHHPLNLDDTLPSLLEDQMWYTLDCGMQSIVEVELELVRLIRLMTRMGMSDVSDRHKLATGNLYSTLTAHWALNICRAGSTPVLLCATRLCSAESWLMSDLLVRIRSVNSVSNVGKWELTLYQIMRCVIVSSR